MAQVDFQDKNYKSMDGKYKDKFSKDEFKGQKRAQAKSRAKKAGDMETANKINMTNRGKIDENSQYYKDNKEGKRELTNFGKGSNPFKVDNIQNFDTAAYGGGSAKGTEKLNMRDVAGLKSQGGFNQAQIQEYVQGLEASGVEIGKGARNKLARMEAKSRAKAAKKNQPEAPTPPKSDSPKTTMPVNFGQSIGGDTGDINVDKTLGGDIGDNNTILGSTLNSDFSVNFNNTGNQGDGGGMSNLMAAAATTALNDNAHAKSKALLNGTGRSAAANAQAELATGASDRVANLYNMVGSRQQYWNDKSTAQQGSYLGDIWNGGGYDWKQAPNPVSTPDRTAEILKDDDDD